MTATNLAGGTATQRSYSDAVDAAIGSATLSDAEKCNILGIRKPDKQTVLPSRDYPDSRRKTGTSPRSLLLKRFEWLAYSGKAGEEGVFCAPCVPFPTLHRQGSTRGEYLIFHSYCWTWPSK